MAPLPPLAVEHNASPRVSHQKPSAPPLRTSTLSTSSGPSSSPAAAVASSTTADGGTPKTTPERTRSPNATRSGPPPKIIVKKEPPTSPELPTSRHRPRKLDLSKDPSGPGTQLLSSRPSGGQLTARDGPLAMQDVGLACLSPGFSTQDPTMREQLQRSISVRDHQRSIIESRLQKTAKPGDNIEGGAKTGDINAPGGLKTPGTSRKRPPPGLSIVPPSHEQFANERVIQSAPLHQTFTGRHQPHPATRHTANQHSNLSNTSHIHHVPATQTNNRLPPITDVFASEGLGAHRGGARNGYYQSGSASNSSHSNTRPSFPSPVNPSTHAPATTTPSARPREYRSAEEAVASMSGGREDLLPKIIHYGGHQPPTPPSPNGNGLTPRKMGHHESGSNLGRSGGGRRRARAEYERDMGSPPLGSGPDARRGPFGEGRESPESQRRKKEEFLTLCSRAWDLFHS
ncbi:MAG: hypothetical protein M1839_005086 [Geoglossum umbratile]|nr:MAG: hypothetical protein M1839_005086 [Geoglossum umbratile]